MSEWLLAQWALPGVRVALALAALALLVLTFGLWAWRTERLHYGRPFGRIDARIEPVATSPAEPLMAADESVQALQVSLAGLEQFEHMQAQLRQRLTTAQQALDSDSSKVSDAVELMRRAAVEMKLPHTVFEIYEGLRLFPRKPASSQAADQAWHQEVGVAPGRVLVLDEPTRQTLVDFSCAGRVMRIAGRSYVLSRSAFDELTLFDGGEQAVLTVRVSLDTDRMQVRSATIEGYRPGSWVPVLVTTRALMDERRERLLMASRYREVDKLRSSFGIEANNRYRRTV